MQHRTLQKMMTRPVVKAYGGGIGPGPRPLTIFDENDQRRQLTSKYPGLPVSDWLPTRDVTSTGTAGISGIDMTSKPNVRPLNGAGPQSADSYSDLPSNESAPAGGGTSKALAMANEFAPYASNIMNSFRKPPMPARGTPNDMVTLNRVNLNNERAGVGRAINAANVGAERSVPGNTAEAIKQYNLGTKLTKLSEISERETNANTNISNQQNLINSQIAAGNNQKLDNYNQDLVERKIADQNFKSSNLANAADKYLAIRNERDKRNVDLEKTKTMASLYMRDGVFQRQARRMRDQKIADPLGQNYSYLD